VRYLISYRSEHRGHVTYGMDVSDDIEHPAVWLEEVQQFPETYILLNAEPLPDHLAKKYWGSFKGM